MRALARYYTLVWAAARSNNIMWALERHHELELAATMYCSLTRTLARYTYLVHVERYCGLTRTPTMHYDLILATPRHYNLMWVVLRF